MFVEELVDDPFETADLLAGVAVLVDDRNQPGEPVLPSDGRHISQIDGFEPAKPGLDLALRTELVADLGGEFGELVPNVVQQQGPGCDQGPAVLWNSFYLGDEVVVDLEGLHRPQGRLGQQRARGRDGVVGVGLVETTGSSLGGHSLSGNLSGVEPGGCQGYRHVLALPADPSTPTSRTRWVVSMSMAATYPSPVSGNDRWSTATPLGSTIPTVNLF